MGFRNPIEAIVPGVQGRVLAVLLTSTGELNVRAIARLGGVSVAQASRVLPGLVVLGIVDRREVPPSSLFCINPAHIASKALMTIADSRRAVLVELGRLAEELIPLSLSVIVFGSVARGDSDAESDIDVMVVRPSDVADGEHWSGQLERWRHAARRVAGNSIEVLEVSERDLADRLSATSGLWLDIKRDGVVVSGRSIPSLAVQNA